MNWLELTSSLVMAMHVCEHACSCATNRSGFEPPASHHVGAHICAVERMRPVVAILVMVILERCIKNFPC